MEEKYWEKMNIIKSGLNSQCSYIAKLIKS